MQLPFLINLVLLVVSHRLITFPLSSNRAPTQFVVTMMCDESQEDKIDSVNFAFSTQIAVSTD